METLNELRQKIDGIDAQLVELFERRMAVTREVGLYKLANHIPVLDSGREEQVLESKTALIHDQELAGDVTELFETIMAISRRQQQAILSQHGETEAR